jgi:plasmid stabilization system protein ParE
MIIRVTEDAADDLEHIQSHIAQGDGAAADRVMQQILSTIHMLAEHPHLGHRGIVEGSFERTVPRTPFVIVYRIDFGSQDELIILRVPRTSQDRARYRYN